MHYLQQILFVVISVAAVWLFAKKAGEIKRNILLGKKEQLNDQPGKRWNNLLLLAFG